MKVADRRRPPVPEEFTYFREADWPGADRHARWRAWGDAADAWGEANGYSGVEMFEAWLVPTGDGGWYLPVDGRPGGPRGR